MQDLDDINAKLKKKLYSPEPAPSTSQMKHLPAEVPTHTSAQGMCFYNHNILPKINILLQSSFAYIIAD